MGAVDSDSVPHACIGNALTAEPSPQPQCSKGFYSYFLLPLFFLAVSGPFPYDSAWPVALFLGICEYRLLRLHSECEHMCVCGGGGGCWGLNPGPYTC